MSDEGAVALIAQIASANAADLAATTNRIEAGLRADVRGLAQGILQLEVILNKALVIDRATEQGIADMTWLFARAESLIEHVDRMEQIANGG